MNIRLAVSDDRDRGLEPVDGDDHFFFASAAVERGDHADHFGAYGRTETEALRAVFDRAMTYVETEEWRLDESPA